MVETFFYDILHVVSQTLLVPDIILLLALIAYSLFSIGSILIERMTEHRHYAVVMPQFLAALTDSDEELIPSVIQESGLLKRQKKALNTVYEYRTLPGDALIALVKRLMNEEEAHYNAIVNRNNMAAKVAPMLGLMGTLIPLGPGIQALGQADTAALSSSLLVAFDTTVAGLVTAAICLVIGKIRSSWYDNYLSALDSAMATMVQRIEDSRTRAPEQQFYYEQAIAAESGPGASSFLTADSAQGGFDATFGAPASQDMAEDPNVMPSGMPILPPDGTDPLGSLFNADPNSH